MAPNPLLVRFSPLLKDGALEGPLRGRPLQGPILDLACGTGENGLYLAAQGLPVVLADRSAEALAVARAAARERGLTAEFWEVDLEAGGDRLPREHYRAILVFRYLHRPLVPHIRDAVRPGGLVIYETFTSEQSTYGKPYNPDFLLQPGELADWFREWHTIHYYEGLLEDPRRAMAQIVCRKPVA